MKHQKDFEHVGMCQYSTEVLRAILATFREDLKTTLHKEKKDEAQYDDQMKTNRVVTLEKRG